MNSKIIQVSTCRMTDYDDPNGHYIVTTVLCEDGTLWRMGLGSGWYKMDLKPAEDYDE